MSVISIDTESVVSDTAWIEVANRDFTLNQDGDFVLFISCEYTTTATNRIAGVRVMLDGNEMRFDHRSPAVASEYMAFSTILDVHLLTGLHNLSIEARTSNAAYPTTVRKKTLVVMKH